MDLSACDISFRECESSMYRARRTIEPKIPLTAIEFSDMLSTTSFGEHHKFTVRCGEQTGVVFFSDQMTTLLADITNVQFDGTFFTVPRQFVQLWTIFVAVGRHTLPAIHCLMTAKNQGLYQAVLENIRESIPHFQPQASMSDWETAARNAFKEVHPQMKLFGCWFHFTQRIWAKKQKLGLSHSFKNNLEISKFIKQLMAIPFLPASLINPTFSLLQMPLVENPELIQLEKLKKYYKKHWLCRIASEELSIFELNIATNNAAESYHSKLKSMIKNSHPRIWTFMSTLNEITKDTDNDIGRLRLGKEISRPRKKKNFKIDENRTHYKQQLRDGNLTPWQFVQSISNTIGNINIDVDHLIQSDSDYSEEETIGSSGGTNIENICVICLSPRTTIWVFMPCRHANCFSACSQQIEDQGERCPVCRSVIETRFRIFN